MAATTGTRDISKSLLFLICFTSFLSYSQDSIPNLEPKFKNIVLNANFDHDKWQTNPVDIKYDFAAYTTSFDSNDPTIDGGEEIAWGIPEWVAFEIKTGTSISGCERPKPWLTDISITEKVKKAAKFMDIRLLDHLIITENQYYSMADEGKL